MPFQISYVNLPRILVAQVTALVDFEDSRAILTDISNKAREEGVERVLVDLTDVVGTLSEEQHQMLGLMCAMTLGHLKRFASVVPPDKRTRQSEAPARQAGLNLRVFTSVEEAVGWLNERP